MVNEKEIKSKFYPVQIILDRTSILILRIILPLIILIIIPIIIFYYSDSTLIEFLNSTFTQLSFFIFLLITPIWILRLIFHKNIYLKIFKNKIIISNLTNKRTIHLSEISSIDVVRNPDTVLVVGSPKLFINMFNINKITIFLNLFRTVNGLEYFSKYMVTLNNLPYLYSKQQIYHYLINLFNAWKTTQEGLESESQRLKSIEEYRNVNKGKNKKVKTDWEYLFKQVLIGLAWAIFVIFVLFILIWIILY